MITAVNSRIIIDILEPDPDHGPSSREARRRCLREGSMVACDVVWAEVAIAFGHAQARGGGTPRDRDHLLGHERGGGASRRGVLVPVQETVRCKERIVADFLVGGHALVQADRLLTRVRGFYREYFKPLKLVMP